MQAAMRRILPSCFALAALSLALGLQAQEANPAPPAAPASAPAWEGAVGLQLDNQPEYPGSHLRKTSLVPGLYLRWGRISVSTAGNFVTRHNDAVARGIGADLVQRKHLRLQLGLRYDKGRKLDANATVAQLDEVRATVRARLGMVWRPVPDWQLGASWNSDILGRQGGGLVEFGAAREWRLSQRTHWSLGGALVWADQRYMRARFGVSPAASLRSGLAAYQPGGGWRDTTLNSQWRIDLDRHWSLWVLGSAGRLLGPARDSPLSAKTSQVAAGAGFAWRF